MIDIEHAALSAFEKQVGAGFICLIERQRHISDQRFDTRYHCQCIREGLLVIDRFDLEIVFQNEVVIIHVLFQLFCEAFRIEQVGDTDGTASDLVFIGRADTLAGRTDLGIASSQFTCQIECGMVRKNQRTGSGNFQS